MTSDCLSSLGTFKLCRINVDRKLEALRVQDTLVNVGVGNDDELLLCAWLPVEPRIRGVDELAVLHSGDLIQVLGCHINGDRRVGHLITKGARESRGISYMDW